VVEGVTLRLALVRSLALRLLKSETSQFALTFTEENP